MMGIAYYDKVKQSDLDVSNARFTHFVSDFVENNYNSIPHLVKNDIRVFFHDFSCMYVTFIHLLVHKKFKEPMELICFFKNLTTTELLNLYLEGNETGLSLQSQPDLIDNCLSDLTQIYNKDAKDKELFNEFIHYPEGVIERFSSAMEIYYNDCFKPSESHLKKNLNIIQKRHQAIYDENPEAFINAILFQSKEALNDENTTIHIYLGYNFGDKVTVVYSNDNSVYFLYGASTERKLYSENIKAQYEELIKSLADDTRRKLIKYLMDAPHYNKEISDYLGITTATISYHIGRLADLGIIYSKYQDGKRIYYQVDKSRFNQLFDGLKRYLSPSHL